MTVKNKIWILLYLVTIWNPPVNKCNIRIVLFGTDDSWTTERTAHGLAYENTVAFPPSAYYFFHPNERKPENKDPCIASKCSPLPLASHVEATQIYENKASAQQKGGKLIGAGAMIGIIFVVAFAVLVAMGVYYVKVTREANMSRASSSVQSHAWYDFYHYNKTSA